VTAPEVAHAVRGYLAQTGGSEVSQVWLGLERQVTPAQIRAALKVLGATKLTSWNVWPTLRETPHIDRSPFTLKKFTMYRLPDMHE
jgi:hypothetical protein